MLSFFILHNSICFNSRSRHAVRQMTCKQTEHSFLWRNPALTAAFAEICWRQMEAPSELMETPSLSLLHFSSIQKGSPLATLLRHNSAPAVKGKKENLFCICMSPAFHSLILSFSKPLLRDLTKHTSCLSSSLYWEWAHKICLDLENPFLVQQWVVPVGSNTVVPVWRDLLSNNHLVQLSGHLKADYKLKHIIKAGERKEITPQPLSLQARQAQSPQLPAGLKWLTHIYPMFLLPPWRSTQTEPVQLCLPALYRHAYKPLSCLSWSPERFGNGLEA